MYHHGSKWTILRQRRHAPPRISLIHVQCSCGGVEINLEVVRGLIEGVYPVPDSGEVSAKAGVADTLSVEDLYGALVPPQNLLNTPRQVVRLVGAPRQHLSRLVDVHAAPPLDIVRDRKHMMHHMTKHDIRTLEYIIPPRATTKPTSRARGRETGTTSACARDNRN